MKCKICDKRPPRRQCPGVYGDICAICCGNEREVTIDCPLTCPYLIEARAHEKYLPVDKKQMPNLDVHLTEQFLVDNQELTLFIAYALYQAIVKTPGSVDTDVRDALDGLTRTYRSLDAGLYHESRPVNPFGAGIFDNVQDAVADYRKEESKSSMRLRDSAILGVLVLQQRLAQTYINGRRKGRAYIDFLRRQFEKFEKDEHVDSPLIVL